MEEFLLLVVTLVMFVAPPVFFVICLVNSIIHVRKYKKGGENKTSFDVRHYLRRGFLLSRCRNITDHLVC